jgi:hypothetical protein
MTILDFYVDKEIVMRVEIPQADYINKVCGSIPIEYLCKNHLTNRELCEFEIDNKRGIYMEFTDKRIIEIWYACFKHGFTNQYYDTWCDKVVKGGQRSSRPRNFSGPETDKDVKAE